MASCQTTPGQITIFFASSLKARFGISQHKLKSRPTSFHIYIDYESISLSICIYKLKTRWQLSGTPRSPASCRRPRRASRLRQPRPHGSLRRPQWLGTHPSTPNATPGSLVSSASTCCITYCKFDSEDMSWPLSSIAMSRLFENILSKMFGRVLVLHGLCWVPVRCVDFFG